MSGNRLIAIAAELGGLYRERAGHEVGMLNIEARLAQRQLELTPLDGWPGKNEAERLIARDRVFAIDPNLGLARASLMMTRQTIIELGARIAGLEAERRALEWTIKEYLAQRLGSVDDGDAFTAALDAIRIKADERLTEDRLAEVSAGLDAMDEEDIFRDRETLSGY